jgi:hypothetical protein
VTPLVKPAIVIGLVTPLCERVEPGAEQVATWFTMGELPTEAGGENDTAMLPSPAVAPPIDGAPGGAGGWLPPPPPPLHAASRASVNKAGIRTGQRSEGRVMTESLVSSGLGRRGF